MTEQQRGDAATGRDRSTIAFPYYDLGSVLELIEVFHDHARECSPDQLAAWLPGDAGTQSGNFRSRVNAARTFGLLERRQGHLVLTDLADRAVDPRQTVGARTQAFLNVDLFRVMHEQFLGKRLPPPSALEQAITTAGVVVTQAKRARQTLMKSALVAGFLEAGRDRLVQPVETGARAGDADDSPLASAAARVDDHATPSVVDPMLRGLFERLPPPGSSWSDDDRGHWMAAAASIFTLVYPGSNASDDAPEASSRVDS